MTAPKKDPSIDHYAAFNKAVQNLFENVNEIHLYIFVKVGCTAHHVYPHTEQQTCM